MDRLFTDLFRDFPGGTSAARGTEFPPLNVVEDAEKLTVEAELPGLTMEDLDIQLKGEVLSLQGEQKARKQEGESYHRQERPVGRFHRVVKLPFPVDLDAISARLVDGVLTVELPKAKEAKPRKIEIKTA
jgi:HSP20 family protein